MTSTDHARARVQPQLAELLALAPAARALPWMRARRHARRGGTHTSRLKGRGMEFDETRAYQAGDDIRHLDWKVTARTGQAHTKLFREERERPVFLSIDCRAPMWFATRGVFKIVQASRLAALFAWQAHFHGDRVGAQCFDETKMWEMPPRHDKHGPLRLFDTLSRFPPPHSTHPTVEPCAPQHVNDAQKAPPIDWSCAVRRLRRHARPGSLIYLIGDFRGLDCVGDDITRLARHADIVLVWIYDKLERQLPERGVYTLSDGARRLRLDCTDHTLRATLATRFAAREKTLRQLARQPGIRLLGVQTDDDPWRLLRDLPCER